VTAVAVRTVSARGATAHVPRTGPGRKLVVSLPAILLIALLSGRLLGASRSLAATALAGAAGWLSALALSPAIAEGDPGAARLWTVWGWCARQCVLVSGSGPLVAVELARPAVIGPG
jgi:hypothetical protein